MPRRPPEHESVITLNATQPQLEETATRTSSKVVARSHKKRSQNPIGMASMGAACNVATACVSDRSTLDDDAAAAAAAAADAAGVRDGADDFLINLPDPGAGGAAICVSDVPNSRARASATSTGARKLMATAKQCGLDAVKTPIYPANVTAR